MLTNQAVLSFPGKILRSNIFLILTFCCISQETKWKCDNQILIVPSFFSILQTLPLIYEVQIYSHQSIHDRDKNISTYRSGSGGYVTILWDSKYHVNITFVASKNCCYNRTIPVFPDYNCTYRRNCVHMQIILSTEDKGYRKSKQFKKN